MLFEAQVIFVNTKMVQATVEEDESGPAKQVGKLIGVDPDVLIDNFVQPKIKVKDIHGILHMEKTTELWPDMLKQKTLDLLMACILDC